MPQEVFQSPMGVAVGHGWNNELFPYVINSAVYQMGQPTSMPGQPMQILQQQNEQQVGLVCISIFILP